ncbi:MAG: glycosyltransferase, partial [Opitutaceae bacterium]|nr:glycosyltransferase [Opitutaceae bacterium]
MPMFYPATQYGGPIVQAYEVGKELLRRGHRVNVVTTDLGLVAETPRNTWVNVEGMRVWYGRTHAINRCVPYWEPQLKRPIVEVLPTTDVLQLRMALTLLNDLVRRLARRRRVPYIYNAEGSLCPTRLKTKAVEKWFFLRLFERRMLREAAALQAVTSVERGDLIAQGADPTRIHVIPNGVVLPTTNYHSSAARFRERWNLPPNATLILYLGRVSRLKGIEPLVRAFHRVRHVQPDAHLIIAGPGDGEERRLSELIQQLDLSGRVKLVGTVPGRECWQALREADLFALTSFTEGLPNAVLEALAAGLPVLCSHPCNLPEVAEYAAGEVVIPEESEIASSLTRMLADAELRR